MSKKLQALKEYFGYDQFRPNQEEIISQVLSGVDLMVVMPTGGGKSMCYQLPAVLSNGVTLVISPLIALMKDQVDALNMVGIEAAYYNSSQDHTQQQEMLEKLNNGSLKIVYSSPESLSLLHNHLQGHEIPLIAIDEAHCISTWGHDFRPAYTQLGYLKKQYPNAALIALTATADRATRADIKTQLNIPEAQEFVSSFDRPNIFLEVRPGQNRMAQLNRFLNKYTNEAGIIYCLSRKSCEQIASKLVVNGLDAAAYHAGLEHHERQAVQDSFINDEIKIVCATIAFGMGIDKSNVRFVVHYNMPKNIEGYYQEIGRAGRDGLDAHAMLFHSYADVIQLRQFAENSGNADVQIAKLERMKQFADALTCRRRMLLSYFNEYQEKECGHCDVCLNKPEIIDATIPAQKALSAIKRMNENAGLNLTVDVLRGAQNAQVMESGYQNIKTYGTGREIPWRAWQQYLNQMINQGIIEVAYHEKNHLKLTPLALKVLFEKQPVSLAVLPKPEEIERRQKSQGSAILKSLEPAHEDLFEDLRQLRLKIAREAAVPPFRIFNDKSLKDMATRIPLTISEFKDTHGVGTKKAVAYGDRFLQILNKHQGKRNEEYAFTGNPVKAKKRTLKVDTVQVSYDLFNEGKSIEDISKERRLVQSTITGHLLKAHANGKDLDLKKLIDPNDLKLIKDSLGDKKEIYGVSQLFDNLGQVISYEAIRIGLVLLNVKVNRKDLGD